MVVYTISLSLICITQEGNGEGKKNATWKCSNVHRSFFYTLAYFGHGIKLVGLDLFFLFSFSKIFTPDLCVFFFLLLFKQFKC